MFLVLLLWNKMELVIATRLGRILPSERTRTCSRRDDNEALGLVRVIKVFWILSDAPGSLVESACRHPTVRALWGEHDVVAFTEEKHVDNAVLNILQNCSALQRKRVALHMCDLRREHQALPQYEGSEKGRGK
jgi:hypothetical protein